jgi:hypothetical protein
MTVFERVEYLEAALLEILSSEDDLSEELGDSAELDRVKHVARRAIVHPGVTLSVLP